MALAKERSIPHESSFMMSCVNNMSPQSPYSPDEFDKQPATTNGIADQFRAANNQPDESQLSVINFSGFLANSDQPLLSFDPKEEYYGSTNSDHQSYQWPPNNNQNSRFSADFSCSFQTASDYSNCASQNGWLYSESTVTTDHSFEESGSQESAGFNKRPNVGESAQVAKKQCTSSTNSSTSKKPKVQKPCPSKDPQSIAAKNRRERISERLKVLQELVPNGSKVDLVTMLEKAIGYVKFLQLQVKVLATDEFWPVQGGKAPDISQVREAIDAILTSSQKDRNSIS